MDVYLDPALSSRRTAAGPARDLTCFNRHRQAFVLHWGAVIARDQAELAYQFTAFAPRALELMELDAVESWLIYALDLYDKKGQMLAIRAFQEGVLDIPFAPSRYNRNQLVTARDCDGAVRFTNPERLPFDDEVRDFHLERIQHRMTQERRTRISELVGADLTRIWQGDFVTWPLDGTYVV